MAKESPFVEIDFEADESITLPFNTGRRGQEKFVKIREMKKLKTRKNVL